MNISSRKQMYAMNDPAERFSHLKINFPDFLSDSELEMTIYALEKTGVRIHTERQGPTAWAALDWVVPGLVAIWIFKSYFDGFLKEAGKDHYQVLKSELMKLVNHTRNYKTQTLVAEGSEGKLEKGSQQSKAISVHVHTADGREIKLLFDLNMDENAWNEALGQILDAVLETYNGEKNFLTATIQHLKGKFLYAYIDPQSKQWIIVDTTGLYKNAQS